MRRNSHDMQVNVAGIRRNIKNFAHNYSDAQKKVREATSNDPWGPSSTIMAEIADLTYNVVAFSEIMQMIWKRLNDHGRNWRHVYKALVLLEYLIKTGSEKVGQQCKENIFAIQTLKDFQYLEEGKDQGQNVREKAKQLVILLKDDERLKNERARALKAKERFAQSASAFGSDGMETPSSPKYPAFRGDWGSRDAVDLPRDIEIARPQTAGEEELQLQLALAMSREEADQEEQKRKSDDVRLQLALSQSQQDFKTTQDKRKHEDSHLVDLLDVNLGGDQAPVDPWGMPQPPRPQQTSPWHPSSLSSPPEVPLASPWTGATGTTTQKTDPWGVPVVPPNISTSPVPPTPKQDPWSPASQSSTDLDEFDIISNRNKVSTSPKTNGSGPDPFELNLLGDSLPTNTTTDSEGNTSTGTTKKTPLSFLGENSALVNLDNLVTKSTEENWLPVKSYSKPANPTLVANPFSDPAINNPPRQVFNTPPPKPSINEMKQQTFAPFGVSAPAQSFSPVPTQPIGSTAAFGGQFSGTATQQAFGGTNGGVFAASSVTPDPWTPVVNSNGTSTNSPWTKSNEPANPFLS
ncbi:epsin-2 isoform X2 [Diabrotica virgifera virgifera]|uniref:Epsin-2 isoform X2 n=1 Tax=Diabrotica virgifera virgifera TaxID=50390 RepID=A0A6P7F1K5_DIAVI|nr:epsin-2 isoform X2 [Diabrotica virgifera virgifera]